jgi:DNA-directed RNA polymerase specialized sigma24 family protein
MANKKKFKPTEEELQEWNEIEELVIQYQTYVDIDNSKCKDAVSELLNRFTPLFKKYILLIKHNQLDFNDMEQKSFASLFIEDTILRRMLNRKVTPVQYKSDIYQRSNFIKETYGTNSEEDILYDLYICFLNVAKRYKQVGKNFCAYLHNVYKYEVARFIKAYIKNPLSVPYKNFQYEDYINGQEDITFIEEQENSYYESITGLPDISWILGETCANEFYCLTSLQRKIIVKYYLEDWSDRQIAESLGVQTSSINGKRREAVNTLCKIYNIDPSTLKRVRKSGTIKDKSK